MLEYAGSLDGNVKHVAVQYNAASGVLRGPNARINSGERTSKSQICTCAYSPSYCVREIEFLKLGELWRESEMGCERSTLSSKRGEVDNVAGVGASSMIHRHWLFFDQRVWFTYLK